LLIIRDAFVTAVGKARRLLPLGELFRLKALFGVGVVQIAQRCLDLEIIGVEEKRRLFDVFSHWRWTKAPFREPNPIRGQEPSRFERLCVRALTDDIISESRAAELLGLTARELGSYFDAAPGALA
jgi:hypothetical protein